jgi:predicted amidohydrolase
LNRVNNNRHPERAHLTPGSESHVAFDTQFGKVGMLVCWDLAFPEAFRDLISQGAEIIIVPAFWLKSDGQGNGHEYNPHSETIFLDATLISRAFENTCCR